MGLITPLYNQTDRLLEDDNMRFSFLPVHLQSTCIKIQKMASRLLYVDGRHCKPYFLGTLVNIVHELSNIIDKNRSLSNFLGLANRNML